MTYHATVSPKSRTIALLLCLFFGVIGAHRFYAGKTFTGLLFLCTGGFGGIGVLIDLFMILTGGFRDVNGCFVSIW